MYRGKICGLLLPLLFSQTALGSGLFPLLTLLGMLAALLTSQSTLNQQDGWRICVAFPVLPSLLVLVTLVFVPESPIWLIAHKTPMGTNVNLISSSTLTIDTIDGYAALEKYRSGEDITMEFNSLYRALSYDARHDQTWRALLITDRSMRYRLGVMSLIQIVRAIFGERVSPLANGPQQLIVSRLPYCSSIQKVDSFFSIRLILNCIDQNFYYISRQLSSFFRVSLAYSSVSHLPNLHPFP
jgi:hypothetical protein